MPDRVLRRGVLVASNIASMSVAVVVTIGQLRYPGVASAVYAVFVGLFIWPAIYFGVALAFETWWKAAEMRRLRRSRVRYPRP